VKNICSFLSGHKHFYMLLLLLPILVWFKYLEATLVPRYIIHMALDDRIPFVREFVVPYLLWFPYIGYGLVYTGIHSRQEYYRLFVFLAGGMSAAYIAYMFFPNAIDFRPIITKNDPFSALVKMIYATDTPTNVCPSVHVINSIAVDAALQHCRDFDTKRYRKPASHILTILIILSTVLIKQHSIADVVWGMIVSVPFYILLYAVPGRKAAGICAGNNRWTLHRIKE